MFGLGTTELIVIGVIIFVIFGAKRIPEIGKGLGGALREFKKVKKELAGDDTSHEPGAQDGKQKQEPPDTKDTLADSVVKQIPGVRQAIDINEKFKKVKDVLQ